MSESQKLRNMSMRQKENRTRATSHFSFDKKLFSDICRANANANIEE